MKALHERLLDKFTIDNGCWLWTGSRNDSGYGIIVKWIDGKQVNFRAHRVVYEMVNGPIPEGLVLDHLCRNRKCVRPDHLEPVTSSENIRRTAGFNKHTHCAKGHQLASGNLSRSSNGTTRCRICKNEWSRAEKLSRRLRGLCSCGNMPAIGKKSCQRCIDQATEYWRRNVACPPKEQG